MATIRLTDDGGEFPFHHGLLKTLAKNYPDKPQYAELAKALIDLGIPSITEHLLDKTFLTVEQRDAIWDNGDVGIRRRLLTVEAFLSHLTDAQARDIIEMNDANMLKAVAEWSELLYPGPHHWEDGLTRLSGAAADMLIEHIRSHEDVRVRAALAENESTPIRFLPALFEYLEAGFRITHSRLKSVTVDDIQALGWQPRDVLVAVAKQVAHIADPEARRAAILMLAAHPDPEVRLALVQSQDAPWFACDLLAKDADQEIAQVARERLQQ